MAMHKSSYPRRGGVAKAEAYRCLLNISRPAATKEIELFATPSKINPEAVYILFQTALDLAAAVIEDGLHALVVAKHLGAET